MTPIDQLRQRIATYRDAEARALIHYLLQCEVWSVSQRLGISSEEAQTTVAQCALDALAGMEGKLP